jgi:TonB family protein
MSPASIFFAASWAWTSADWVNHLWQSTVVGLGVLVLLAAGRPLTAGTRRTLGWIALIKFALPAALFARLAEIAGSAYGRWFESSTVKIPGALTMERFVVLADGTGTPGPNYLGVGLVAIWLAGAAACLTLWIVRGRRQRYDILADTAAPSAELDRAIAMAAARAGLSRPPRCLVVAEGYGPGVLGLLAPVVILPRGLETSLTPAELEAILIHEFIHLRRRDNLGRAIQAGFLCLFWYHPIVWLLNRCIGAETERSCDERVLEITADPASYADGIVKTIRHTLGVPQLGFAMAANPPVLLRLKGIMEFGTHRRRPAIRVTALVTGGLLFVLSGQAGVVVMRARNRVETMAAPAGSPVASLAVPTTPAVTLPAQNLPAPPEATGPAATPADEKTAELMTVESPSIAINRPALPAEIATPGPITLSIPQPSAEIPVPPRTALPAIVTIAERPAKTGTTADGIFALADLDRVPSIRFQARPVYPFAMRAAKTTGEVVVGFVIDASGTVRDAHAVHSTQSGFEAAAVAAVAQWRFRPGQKGGKAVATRMQVPIVFSITDR